MDSQSAQSIDRQEDGKKERRKKRRESETARKREAFQAQSCKLTSSI